MMSMQDARLVINKYVTMQQILSAPATVAKRSEYHLFKLFAPGVGQAIAGALLAFRQGGPNGLLKYVQLQDAVKAAMGPVKKVLPIAMQGMQNLLEKYLVQIFKMLT